MIKGGTHYKFLLPYTILLVFREVEGLGKLNQST